MSKPSGGYQLKYFGLTLMFVILGLTQAAANGQGLIGTGRTGCSLGRRWSEEAVVISDELVMGLTLIIAILAIVFILVQRLRDFQTIALLKSRLGICCKNNWRDARLKTIQLAVVMLAPLLVYGAGIAALNLQLGQCRSFP